MRHTATLLAAAFLLSAPAALAAQTPAEAGRYERMHRTWTVDSVLVALAKEGGTEWTGRAMDLETRWAGTAALDILDGEGAWPWQRLEGVASPMSEIERDTFAARLVAFAVANPGSAGASEIVRVMWHRGDFDAVLRMYEAGVESAKLRHLLRIDPRRGIEVGMEKLRANRWRFDPRSESWRPEDPAFRPKVPGFVEMCRFIGEQAPPFGTLAAVNGRPVFTFHEGADLAPGSDGRKPTKEARDALDDATNALYEAGVIDSPCPYPGVAGSARYTKHDPPTPPRGK